VFHGSSVRLVGGEPLSHGPWFFQSICLRHALARANAVWLKYRRDAEAACRPITFILSRFAATDPPASYPGTCIVVLCGYPPAETVYVWSRFDEPYRQYDPGSTCESRSGIIAWRASAVRAASRTAPIRTGNGAFGTATTRIGRVRVVRGLRHGTGVDGIPRKGEK